MASRPSSQVEDSMKSPQVSSSRQTEHDLSPLDDERDHNDRRPSQYALEQRWNASHGSLSHVVDLVPVGDYLNQSSSDLDEADKANDSNSQKPSRGDGNIKHEYPTGGKLLGPDAPSRPSIVSHSEANDMEVNFGVLIRSSIVFYFLKDRFYPRTLRSFFDFQDGNNIAQAVPTPEDYHRFYWKCMDLKSELVRLDFALRPIGSSGPGIQAANVVKTKLRQLRDLSGMNTSILFPQDANTQMYTPTDSQAYLTQVSRSFEDFAGGLDMMAKALNDFNGVYHDEKLMLLLFSLHKRFMDEAMKTSIYYAVRHARATEEFRLHFQVLLKDWIEAAVESLTEAVKDFNDKGVRTIYSAQQHKTSRYLDMSTIATFFSAVTAAMLQFTINNNSQPVSVVTNTFMFSSLVFSIGSAVNSLLVTAWRRSFVREPDKALPYWYSAWLNSGPMVSLVVAGAFFSVALCLLMFSSGQHLVTRGVILVFSGIHAAGLLLLSVLFISEKWTFRNEAGPVGKGLTEDSFSLFLIDMAAKCLKTLNHVQTHQRGAEHRAVGVRSANLEAQTILPEKVESFEPFESQAFQNALSDETFLLNTKYVYGLSTSLWPIPALAPDPLSSVNSHLSKYGLREPEKDLSPPNADTGWSKAGWRMHVHLASKAGTRRSWERNDTGVQWQGVQPLLPTAAITRADHEEHTSDASRAASPASSSWHDSPPQKGESTSDTPAPEQEQPEPETPLDIGHGGNSRRNEGDDNEPRRRLTGQLGQPQESQPYVRSAWRVIRSRPRPRRGKENGIFGADTGHEIELPKETQEPRPFIRPAWRSAPPRIIERRRGRVEPKPYAPPEPIPEYVYQAPIHRGHIDNTVRTGPPQPSSDVRAAALFLEQTQGWTSRIPRVPSIPPASYGPLRGRHRDPPSPPQPPPEAWPSWATWQPNFAPTTLPPVRSWATWQPDPNFAPTPSPSSPPEAQPRVGLFGPRSPRQSVELPQPRTPIKSSPITVGSVKPTRSKTAAPPDTT
ncbi:hypothetical protein M0805_003335 [Coniferiporia weirii]|nr:hypothetical protein M0805_003335 [Coniferiporia weirii]